MNVCSYFIKSDDRGRSEEVIKGRDLSLQREGQSAIDIPFLTLSLYYAKDPENVWTCTPGLVETTQMLLGKGGRDLIFNISPSLGGERERVELSG